MKNYLKIIFFIALVKSFTTYAAEKSPLPPHKGKIPRASLRKIFPQGQSVFLNGPGSSELIHFAKVEEQSLMPFAKAYARQLSDGHGLGIPSTLDSDVIVSIQPLIDDYNEFVGSKSQISKKEAREYREKLFQVFFPEYFKSFAKKSLELCAMLKRINYTPPIGESYIISGCTGIDASLEYLALQHYFRQFPESSFKYIAIDKNADAISFNQRFFDTLSIPDNLLLADGIEKTEEILLSHRIDPRSVSLFICNHPPLYNQEYSLKYQDSSIGEAFIKEMSKPIFAQAKKCINIYFSSENEILTYLLESHGISFEVIYRGKKGDVECIAPLVDGPFRTNYMNAYNAYRVSFIL